MKKSVQILMLLALFPLAGNAREETLEERKQRIVRKYLRERASITQSDMVVPTEYQEDERLEDSEKFKASEMDLQRQDGPGEQFVPPPPPRPVPRADENWLLEGTDEMTEFDRYGNPVDADAEGSDSWSAWAGEEKAAKPPASRRSDRRYNPYVEEQQGGIENREQLNPRSQTFGSSPFSSSSSLFGRPPQESSSTTGFGVQSAPRTFGAAPDEGLLLSPYGRGDSSEMDDKSGIEAPRGYTPYKSPYQQEREQRGQPAWTQPAETEFKRPDSYQQWKSNRQEWDPTSDDAYINEMMPKTRR